MLIMYIGCVASRNSPVCVCKRVQCASNDSQHCVSSKPFHYVNFWSNMLYIMEPNNTCCDGENGCRVIFGMLIALPITLVYYIFLGLWIGSCAFNFNWLLRTPRRLVILFIRNQEINKSFDFVGKSGKLWTRRRYAFGFGSVSKFVEHNKST